MVLILLETDTDVYQQLANSATMNLVTAIPSTWTHFKLLVNHNLIKKIHWLFELFWFKYLQ